MKKTFSRNALRSVLALGLAGTLALAGASVAFADATTGTTGSTSMKLKIDSTQITTTVPTTVEIMVKGDGTFLPPDTVQIVNNSVFAVHISKVKATVSSSNAFNLVSESSFGSTSGKDDVLWMSVTAGTDKIDLSEAKDAEKETKAGQWNMAYTGKANDADKLNLTIDGKVTNSTIIKSDSAVEAVSLQWIIAAGEATAPVV